VDPFDWPPALATAELGGGVLIKARSVDNMMELYPLGPCPAAIWSISSSTSNEFDISLASEKRSTRAAALASSPPPPSAVKMSSAVMNLTKSE